MPSHQGAPGGKLACSPVAFQWLYFKRVFRDPALPFVHPVIYAVFLRAPFLLNPSEGFAQDR
jgi:hypothetical protein